MFGSYTDDKDIDIATGNDLEIIGERHGVIRRSTVPVGLYGHVSPEPDSDYRERIKASMPRSMYDFSGDAVRESAAPREKTPEELAKERKQKLTDFFFPHKNNRGCECGVWLIGYTEPGPNHSDFCRLYRKDTVGGW